MFKSVKKKIFLIGILLCLFLAPVIKNAWAYQSTDGIEGWEEAVYGVEEFNQQSHTNETFTDLAISAIEAIVGPSDSEYQTPEREGALNTTSNLIAAMYASPPVSSVDYFADLGRRLNIVKPALAQPQQGIGFEGLSPILPLWKAFRNLAYLFFTIIFVIIGFAIMFRVKLDPQTVISIQNAIPRVVIALILVTFSYAIAGLLIDFIYLIISLGVLILAPIGGLNVAEMQQKYMNLNFGEGLGSIFGSISGEVWPLFLLPALIGGALTAFIPPVGWTAAAIGSGVTILLFLILAIIALWVMIKLFLSLLKCYISIILSVIIAPLQIMLGAIPGVQMGFGSWIKNLFANIVVFPAVALFMLLGYILISSTGPTWAPPGLAIGGEYLVAIMGFGLLLMIHKIPDVVKEAFQIKPSSFGTAIGEALAPTKVLGKLGARAAPPVFAEKALYGESGKIRTYLARIGEMAGTWRRPETGA